MKLKISSFLLLRIGLSFVFFYAAISSFLMPDYWIAYFPSFLTNNLPNQPLLIGFSVFEIVLGVWLLWGIKIFYPALLSALSMLGILIFNFAQMDVLFRDVAILFMALALMFQDQQKN